MFKSAIEGEIREHESVEDVVDHVTSKVFFEVDRDDLERRLEKMEPDGTIFLRNDCAIYRYSNETY